MKAYIFLLLMSATSAFALQQKTISCPNEIKVEERLATLPFGWSQFQAETLHYWNRATLYSGKPVENASLKPESITAKKSVWQFSASDAIYLSCGYYQTSVELVKALPTKLTRCTVWYEDEIPKKIACE